MLFAFFKFQEMSHHWSDWQRYIYFVVAFSLTLTGLKQVVASWQNRKVRRTKLTRHHRFKVAIPVEGVVYLVMMSVLFLGAMLGKNNMPLLVFAIMAGAFIVNGFISFNSLRKLTLEREVPDVLTVGEPFSVFLNVTNRKRMVVWIVQVSDEISNDRETLTANVVFTRIRGRSQQTGQYRLQLMQRGRYVLGPVEFSTRFPLGIVQRSLLLNDRKEIIVCPRPGKLLLELSGTRQSDEVVFHRETRQGIYDDEFHRIREYRSGDNPRAIHWRTTARRNELMVREFHETRDENLMVLLDLWQPARASLEQLETVEAAVSFAVTLFRTHLDRVRDSELHLGCAGREFTAWTGQSGFGHWESLLRFAGLLEAGESNAINQLRDYWRRIRSPRLRAVLVTTRNFEELSAILAKLPAENADPATGMFEQDVLIYSAAGGALDSVFIPSHKLLEKQVQL